MTELVVRIVYKLLKQIIPACALSLFIPFAVNLSLECIILQPQRPAELHGKEYAELTEQEKADQERVLKEYWAAHESYKFKLHVSACIIGIILMLIGFLLQVNFLDLAIFGGGLFIFSLNIWQLPLNWKLGFSIAVITLLALVLIWQRKKILVEGEK